MTRTLLGRRSGSRPGGRRAWWPARGEASRDQGEELIEDHLVVLRSRRPFGVKLHRAHRQVVVHQTLDRSIVQIAMTHAETTARGQALGIDLELVILRRHGHPARPQVEHRMITAVVAEAK